MKMKRNLTLLTVLTVLLLTGMIPAKATRLRARGISSPADYHKFTYITTPDLFKRGFKYIENGLQADSAQLCFTVIIDRFDDGEAGEKDWPYVSAALLNMGFLYQDVYYDYSRAYGYFLRAVNMAEKYGYNYDKPYAYLGLASINQYVDIGSSPLEAPIELVKKALHGAKENGDDKIMTIGAVNLCELVIDNDCYKKYEPEFNLIKQYRFPAGAVGLPYMRCFLEGTEAFARKDYVKMVDAFDKAIREAESISEWGDKFGLFATQQKVKALRLAGRGDEVPALLKEFLATARENDMQEYILYALKELYGQMRALGNETEAREYEYRYFHLNDSLQKSNNLARVKDAAFLSDIEESQAEVRRLKTERRIHTVIIISVSVIALLVAIALAYYILTKRKLKAMNLKLYDRVQELMSTPPAPLALAKETTPDSDKGKEDDEEESDSAHRIDSGRAAEIYAKVTEILENSPEIYNQEFSIKTLAEMTGEPYYDVSAAINDLSGSNFKSLLLAYRIREACRRLSDEKNYGNQTMEGIALGLGFKSRTYFNAVFKKETGLTPSAYMKIAREKQ